MHQYGAQSRVGENDFFPRSHRRIALEQCLHIEVQGCAQRWNLGEQRKGEGAGFAGGILSAGVDGIRVGEAVGASLLGVELAYPATRSGSQSTYG